MLFVFISAGLIRFSTKRDMFVFQHQRRVSSLSITHVEIPPRYVDEHENRVKRNGHFLIQRRNIRV